MRRIDQGLTFPIHVRLDFARPAFATYAAPTCRAASCIRCRACPAEARRSRLLGVHLDIFQWTRSVCDVLRAAVQPEPGSACCDDTWGSFSILVFPFSLLSAFCPFSYSLFKTRSAPFSFLRSPGPFSLPFLSPFSASITQEPVKIPAAGVSRLHIGGQELFRRGDSWPRWCRSPRGPADRGGRCRAPSGCAHRPRAG